jgi:hypothetical protein
MTNTQYWLDDFHEAKERIYDETENIKRISRGLEYALPNIAKDLNISYQELTIALNTLNKSINKMFNEQRSNHLELIDTASTACLKTKESK